MAPEGLNPCQKGKGGSRLFPKGLPMRRKRISKERHTRYMESSKWQEVRSRYYKSKLWIKLLDRKCYCCQEKKSCDLHHKTYKRFENEKLSDLVAICRECHTEVHEIERLGSSLYSAAKKIKSIKTGKRKAINVYESAKNQRLSKEKKKKKRFNDRKWFHGLNSKDRKLLEMELSLRRRGIKY